MTENFTFVLFSTNPTFIREAVAAGVQAVIVDWERQGKEQRQANADTQIGTDTLADLQKVRNATEALVICRLNAFNGTTATEVEQAVAAGADEILLPMVRCAHEVEKVIELANGRCGVGVLIETVEAVQSARDIGRLPIARAYVGLNDLRIARATPSIFTALADGTVEGIREHFASPFGFGGLTLPDKGEPIPCRLLIAEMARLDASFSFLRRSFHRDVRVGEIAPAVRRIREALASATHRETQQIDNDAAELRELILA
jgi:HpcH/HpaI aldolase/citrate lyase family protein